MSLIKMIALGATLALGLITSSAAAEPMKVGFIYIGPVGDLGWTHQHDVGRQAIDAAFGDKVQTSYVESVPAGKDAERVMTQMALSGTRLIFATSFDYMRAVQKVAKKFPDVKFEHATGYMRGPNISTYSARFYQGRTVIGHIAGKMTKTNIIGYIASVPIPEVVRGINAAYLAAKAANPKVKFKIIWVHSWFDPGKEADAANKLIQEGADIIMQHTDSPAAMTIAEKKGVYAFGQATDMKKFGPHAQLSAIIDNWGPYYVKRVKAVMDGTWTSKNTWDGIGPGMTQIGRFSDAIPVDVKASANAIKEGLAKGTLHSFTGPINKQDGSTWLKAGEVADDATLANMDFYVQGIEGTLPK